MLTSRTTAKHAELESAVRDRDAMASELQQALDGQRTQKQVIDTLTLEIETLRRQVDVLGRKLDRVTEDALQQASRELKQVVDELDSTREELAQERIIRKAAERRLELVRLAHA